MLASITPLGERGRGRRWAVSAPAYVLGSVLGGLAVGSLAGGLGGLLLPGVGTAGRLLVLLLGVLAALALELLLRGRRAPGPARQVNEDWLEAYREWVYGAGFGLQLGAAVLTQVATAAVWSMLLAAALTGSLPAGALIGAVFGLVRALPVLATHRVGDPAALRALHRRAARAARPVRAATVGVLAATAVVVTGSLVVAGAS